MRCQTDNWYHVVSRCSSIICEWHLAVYRDVLRFVFHLNAWNENFVSDPRLLWLALTATLPPLLIETPAYEHWQELMTVVGPTGFRGAISFLILTMLNYYKHKIHDSVNEIGVMDWKGYEVGGNKSKCKWREKSSANLSHFLDPGYYGQLSYRKARSWRHTFNLPNSSMTGFTISSSPFSTLSVKKRNMELEFEQKLTGRKFVKVIRLVSPLSSYWLQSTKFPL